MDPVRSTNIATARLVSVPSKLSGTRPQAAPRECVSAYSFVCGGMDADALEHRDVLCGFLTDTPRTPLDGAGGKLLPPTSALLGAGACQLVWRVRALGGGMDAGALRPAAQYTCPRSHGRHTRTRRLQRRQSNSRTPSPTAHAPSTRPLDSTGASRHKGYAERLAHKQP